MKKQNSPNKKTKRSLPDKVFNKKGLKYKGALTEVKNSKELIHQYGNIIESKERIDPPQKEGDKPVSIPLSPTEVKHYRFLLKAEKLELKKKERKLKKVSDDLNKALKHQSEVVLSGMKKINETVEAERKAKREKVERKEMVVNIVINLKTTVDPRFVSLLNAVEDSRSFRKELDAILKQEDEVTYTTISGLSAVKTDIYKSVRAELFPKDEDDNSADTGNDDDEDTAAAVVPAG